MRLAALLGNPLPIQRESNNPQPPEVTDTVIAFNGIGAMGHETMFLEKDASGFLFCKTNRKPYDKVVMLLLTLAHHYAPDVWDISSDGEDIEWLPTVSWMNEVTGINYQVPDGVLTPGTSTY